MNVIQETQLALSELDYNQIVSTVEAIRGARQVFCVGNGGGSAHAMHFAADLRKIAKVRAHSFDSIPEMTARINDDGWERAWTDWMFGFGWNHEYDVMFTFSVGGSCDPSVSRNIAGAKYGIVGMNGQWMGTRIVVPSTSTPVIEGCQSVIAHHIVEQLAS